MLGAKWQSWPLVVILALVALSSALNLDQALHIDGIEAYVHHGMKRQASGTGTSQDASQDASSGASQTQAPSSNIPVSTPAASTPAPSSATPSSNTDNTHPSSTKAPDSSSAAPSSSKITTPVVKTTPLLATSVQQYTTVIMTVSNGQSVAITQVASSTALLSTGQAEVTQLPNPQQGSGDSGSGLSSSNKKIIGGVVGGIGAAILIGGIAIVLLRLRSKNRVAEDDDDLMAGTGSALGDKTHSSPNQTPFQSSLEQYHTPGGRPNAAANF